MWIGNFTAYLLWAYLLHDKYFTHELIVTEIENDSPKYKIVKKQ